MNQTVVASVNGSDVETYYYDDYGNSSSVGHGYNGELKDETGLIYLRARYYDPSIARFIQIDTNYEGEKEEVVTQNRYTYTLNNPYKYVDRDGNAVEADGIGGGSSLAGLIQSPANGWLPVSWIAKSATETYFVNWYLIHNFNSKYYQDGIAQYRRRKSSARVNDTSKIKLQATSTSGSGGSGGSGTGTTNNNGNTGIGNTGDNSQSDTNSNPVRTFTNVRTDCPKNQEMIVIVVGSGTINSVVSKINSLLSSIDKHNILRRAYESMAYFDSYLNEFYKNNNYVVGKTNDKIIDMTYLFEKILQVNGKIVNEYLETPIHYSDYYYMTTSGVEISYEMYRPVAFPEKLAAFYNLVKSYGDWDFKNRKVTGDYIWREWFIYNNQMISTDYFGNYHYGYVAEAMFQAMPAITIGESKWGREAFIINSAGLAQQISNNGKFIGPFSWLAIRVGSGFSNTGDNEGDTQMIIEGMEKWYRDNK